VTLTSSLRLKAGDFNGRGLEPEPHAGTLATTTDILRRERRFLPGLTTGVSTPRNR
jgi:hypothetical protein